MDFGVSAEVSEGEVIKNIGDLGTQDIFYNNNIADEKSELHAIGKALYGLAYGKEIDINTSVDELGIAKSKDEFDQLIFSLLSATSDKEKGKVDEKYQNSNTPETDKRLDLNILRKCSA